eukprot:3310848-Pyramimonas_sp.AAC.1
MWTRNVHSDPFAKPWGPRASAGQPFTAWLYVGSHAGDRRRGFRRRCDAAERTFRTHHQVY